MKRIAILDDYQDITRSMPEWDGLAARANIEVFRSTRRRTRGERPEPPDVRP